MSCLSAAFEQSAEQLIRQRRWQQTSNNPVTGSTITGNAHINALPLPPPLNDSPGNNLNKAGMHLRTNEDQPPEYAFEDC